jgi:hypothetical protein
MNCLEHATQYGIAYGVVALLRDLEKEFVIKDFGDLHYFLGTEVKKKKGETLDDARKICMHVTFFNVSTCKLSLVDAWG